MTKNVFLRFLQASMMCCLAVVLLGCDDAFGTSDNPVSANMSLNDAPVTMKLGEKFTRRVFLASSAVVTFSSSHPEVASVDEVGTVTALSEGTTTITATVTGEDSRGQVTYLPMSLSYQVTVEPNSLFTYLKWDEVQSKLVETPVTAAEAAGFKVVENAIGNVNWAAGTYLVEKNVTINGNIALLGNVELIIKDGCKLTVYDGQINGDDGSYNLNVYGGKAMSGELAVYKDNDAITSIAAFNIHSCKVRAYCTSTGNSVGGVYYVSELNVYGGLLDAQCAGGGNGYGISLANGGSLNIYGGEVIAVGNGNVNVSNSSNSYGICSYYDNEFVTVNFYGGKLFAACDSKSAFKSNVTLNNNSTIKTEKSSNGNDWNQMGPLDAPSGVKYVRIGDFSSVD